MKSSREIKYENYIVENIIQKLSLSPDDLGFTVINKQAHATDYHKRLSLSNFVLGFFIDKAKFMGAVENQWRPFNCFYVNGAAYGGLIGKPEAFVTYIQELLKDNSRLVNLKYKQMLFQENKSSGMCLSWFTGDLDGIGYFSHTGAGGGYYFEIRLYPAIKRGSVIFFNRTGMSDKRYLDRVDRLIINT